MRDPTTRSIPIRCENRFGLTHCVIRRTRKIPIATKRLAATHDSACGPLEPEPSAAVVALLS